MNEQVRADEDDSNPVCPMSNTAFMYPCPVVNCPFCLSQSTDNCLAIRCSGTVDAHTLAEALGVAHNTEFKTKVSGEIEALARAARDIREMLDADKSKHCPECGYVRPCSSTAVCQERREIAADESVNIGRALTAAELWWLAINGKTNILPRKTLRQLQQLASHRDIAPI